MTSANFSKLSRLSPAALKALETELRRSITEDERRTRLFSYYPDDGPLRRELYIKHLEFFAAGAEHRERLFLAANRVGKTEGVGGYELSLHLTGLYPDWWQGRRFDRPINAVAAGDTGKTTRDIIQRKLLGEHGDFGTGLIPWKALARTTAKSGVADAIDTVKVKYRTGGQSTLVLRSYDQKREAFQGDEQDVVWLDEEPPMPIYGECLIRTMTTNGLIMLTFTPLNGWSDVVRAFLQGPAVV